jgi:hypothetical protein
VPLPAALFEAVVALVAREDRDLEAPVFAGFRNSDCESDGDLNATARAA